MGLGSVRSRIAAGGIAVALLGVGVGVSAAATSGDSSPDTRTVSDVSVPTTAAVTTVAPVAPAAVVQAVPVVPPVAQTSQESVPAATVDDVPTPAQTTHTPIPADQDTSGIGTTGEDGRYTPAPPSQGPGEPPMGVVEEGPPVELTPGQILNQQDEQQGG